MHHNTQTPHFKRPHTTQLQAQRWHVHDVLLRSNEILRSILALLQSLNWIHHQTIHLQSHKYIPQWHKLRSYLSESQLRPHRKVFYFQCDCPWRIHFLIVPSMAWRHQRLYLLLQDKNILNRGVFTSIRWVFWELATCLCFAAYQWTLLGVLVAFQISTGVLS